MGRTVLVGLGGLVGGVARYWLAGAVQRVGGSAFPAGTLAVNLLGSFVVGVVMALSLERGMINADLRTFLAVGFCGGFTTMSTFSYETVALIGDGEPFRALSNAVVTMAGCFGAVWFGTLMARVL
jgi:CrcB protein